MNQKKNAFLTKTWVVALLAFVCCALWGSAITMIKTGYECMSIDPSDTASIILFAGLRFALAGVLVVAFECIRQKKPVLPTGNIFKYAIPLCMAQTVGQYFFFYIGVAHTSGVKSSIITGMGNFVAILMSCFLFRREKITKEKIIGCVLGFGGVVVINVFGNQLDLGMSLQGEGALLMAQIAYGASTVMISIFSKKESAVILSGYQFFIGGLILSAIGIVMGGRISITFGAGPLILLYLAFVSAMAYTLWSILLTHNPVSKVAIYGFMNPIISVLLSAFVLGEFKQAFHAGSLMALILVCAGIYIVNRRK